ncbi:MAG: hypothetical protein V4621_08250 [Pseudomonadota bacterium]
MTFTDIVKLQSVAYDLLKMNQHLIADLQEAAHTIKVLAWTVFALAVALVYLFGKYVALKATKAPQILELKVTRVGIVGRMGQPVGFDVEFDRAMAAAKKKNAGLFGIS